MKILNTPINGVYIIESPLIEDLRGSFSRLFCNHSIGEKIFESTKIEQINLSITNEAGTIRGLHYQIAPQMECKVIRCLQGKVFDVAVDLRQNSESLFKWYGIELTPENNRAIIIPEGCAHGFQSMQNNSSLLYLHTAAYSPPLERGIRFDDPLISITWPLKPKNLSDRDLGFTYLDKKFKGLIK